MDSFLRRLTMRITMHEYYDTAVEVYYFTKAAAYIMRRITTHDYYDAAVEVCYLTKGVAATMNFIMKHAVKHRSYNTARELYYYTKGEALEAAESAEEFRQVVMDMLQTATVMGKQWALKMTKMILQFLQPATELGGKWAEIALDALAHYWGFARGDGDRAASDVFEVELAEIFARHSSSSSSPCPTE